MNKRKEAASRAIALYPNVIFSNQGKIATLLKLGVPSTDVYVDSKKHQDIGGGRMLTHLVYDSVAPNVNPTTVLLLFFADKSANVNPPFPSSTSISFDIINKNT